MSNYTLLEETSGRQSVPSVFSHDEHLPSTAISNPLEKKQEFNILEKLKLLREQKKYCDVVLDIKGTKLEAHKNVLASWSPYFAGKLNNIDSSVYKDVIIVNYDNSEVFADLLDFMYNGYVAPRETNFLQLLHLAVSFHIETLKNYCEEFLRCNLHLGNFVSTYFLSRKYRLENLEEYIVGFLQLNLSDAVKQGEFLSLKAEKFNTFLSKGWMEKIKPEIKLFLIISWVGYDVQEREKFLVLLLGHIDWSAVANDFLLEINRTENFFTSHESSLYLLLQTLYSAGIPLGPYTEVFPLLRKSHSEILNEVVHTSLLQIEAEDYHQVTIAVSPRPAYRVASMNTEKSFLQMKLTETAMNTDVNSHHFEQTELDDHGVYGSENNCLETGAMDSEKMTDFGKFLESEIHEMNQKEKEKRKDAGNKKEACQSECGLNTVGNISQQNSSCTKLGRLKRQSGAVKKSTPAIDYENYENEDDNDEFLLEDENSSTGKSDTRKTRDVIIQHSSGQSSFRVKGGRKGGRKSLKPGKSLECKYKDCAYITKFKQRMDKHVKFVHESSLEIRCNLCPFEAKEVRKYNTHMKQHFPGPPYSCDQPRCTYTADRIQPLLAHRSTHTGERQFNCEECGMSFKTNNTLIAHRRIHSGKREFECPECHQCFTMKNTLNQHMVVHSNSRPYLCDLCGFSTKFQSHLIAHKRLHSGDVFNCQFPKCSYFTPKRSQLKAHMRAHLGVRAHVCQTCAKSFVEKSHLNRHEKLHSSARLECPECDFTTTRKDKLKEHLTKHHSEDALLKPKKARIVGNNRKKKTTESQQKGKSAAPAAVFVKWDHGGYSVNNTQFMQPVSHASDQVILNPDNFCVMRDQLNGHEQMQQILTMDQMNSQISDNKGLASEMSLAPQTIGEGGDLVITPAENPLIVNSSLPTMVELTSSEAGIQSVPGTSVVASYPASQTYTIIQPGQTQAGAQTQEYNGLSAFMALF